MSVNIAEAEATDSVKDNSSEYTTNIEKPSVQKDGELDTKPSHLKLPDWFYDNCVKLAEELSAHSNFVAVCDDGPSEQDGVQALDADGKYTYQVDEVEYEPLLDLCNLQRASNSATDAIISDGTSFTHEAAFLCFPEGGLVNGSQRFFDAIVRQFARDTRADLVTLSLDDIKDIKQWRSGWRPIGHDEALVDILPTGQSTIPFGDLLKSPIGKFEQQSKDEPRAREPPLVLHLPQIDEVVSLWGTEILGRIGDAMPQNGIVLLSSGASTATVPATYGPYSRCPNKKFNERCNGTSKCNPDTPIFKPIFVTPIRTTAQRELLQSDNEAEKSYVTANTRLLKRSLRRVSLQHWSMPLLQPLTKWDFLQGSHTRTYLASCPLEEFDVQKIIGAISATGDQKQVTKVLDKFGRRKQATEPWTGTTESANKWSAFSDHVQAALREIESNPCSYEWELTYLKNLVDPKEVEDGWGNIALEDNLKDSVQRLVGQASKTATPAYGVLKHGRIRGALLYGPPGTGKTHLARVLAKESGRIMICVSAADIIHKYIGESEKAVQALFSLGRKLSPCILFIDEADALFRPRSSNDRTWERNLINQLLQEMDGLNKSKNSPFVLLATNLPHQVDHALLRRVTSRIHIGLPSAKIRMGIWKICLREEILNPDVNFKFLAQKTAGYSGSDIQTVCVQAALSCKTLRDDGKRILSASDFNTALRTCAPTTSKTILADLAAFARQFDPNSTPPESSEGEVDSD